MLSVSKKLVKALNEEQFDKTFGNHAIIRCSNYYCYEYRLGHEVFKYNTAFTYHGNYIVYINANKKTFKTDYCCWYTSSTHRAIESHTQALQEAGYKNETIQHPIGDIVPVKSRKTGVVYW